MVFCDMQDNLYWLGLLTHLQSDHVPGKTLDVLRDLIQMYESATVEDICEALAEFNLDDESVYTCIGVSGKQAPELAPFEVQNAGNLLSVQQSKRSPFPSCCPEWPVVKSHPQRSRLICLIVLPISALHFFQY